MTSPYVTIWWGGVANYYKTGVGKIQHKIIINAISDYKILLYELKYYTYEVEADNEGEAFDKAHEEFLDEMRGSVASTWYDDVEIECNEDEEEN